jgi:hypothetical protein
LRALGRFRVVHRGRVKEFGIGHDFHARQLAGNAQPSGLKCVHGGVVQLETLDVREIPNFERAIKVG